MVGVGVAAGDAGDAEPLRQALEPAVARPVAPPQRPLQLDPEALLPERAEQPSRRRLGPSRVAALPASCHRALAGTAREADEPLGAALELVERQRRRQGLAHPGVSIALARSLVG